jgi:hypothetical protein
VIPNTISDPKETSGLSALMVSENFGLSGFVCALSATAKTTEASSADVSIFVDFIIVPPPLALHHPVYCRWGSEALVQSLQVPSRLDIRRATDSVPYQRS